MPGCASCVLQEVASLSGMLSETVTRVTVTVKPERALPMALPPHGYEHLYSSGDPRCMLGPVHAIAGNNAKVMGKPEAPSPLTGAETRKEEMKRAHIRAVVCGSQPSTPVGLTMPVNGIGVPASAPSAGKSSLSWMLITI